MSRQHLALVRGKYWLQAEERASALKEALAAETTKRDALQRDAALAEVRSLRSCRYVMHLPSHSMTMSVDSTHSVCARCERLSCSTSSGRWTPALRKSRRSKHSFVKPSERSQTRTRSSSARVCSTRKSARSSRCVLCAALGAWCLVLGAWSLVQPTSLCLSLDRQVVRCETPREREAHASVLCALCASHTLTRTDRATTELPHHAGASRRAQPPTVRARGSLQHMTCCVWSVW